MITLKRGLFVLLVLSCFSFLFWLYWQYQTENRLNQKLDMLSGKVELQQAVKPADNAPEPATDNNVRQQVDSPAENPILKKYKPKQATPVQLTDSELAERKLKAEQKQAQINELILELDQNLANANKKAQIQQKMDELLMEYNQLILPVALTAMAEKNAERKNKG